MDFVTAQWECDSNAEASYWAGETRKSQRNTKQTLTESKLLSLICLHIYCVSSLYVLCSKTQKLNWIACRFSPSRWSVDKAFQICTWNKLTLILHVKLCELYYSSFSTCFYTGSQYRKQKRVTAESHHLFCEPPLHLNVILLASVQSSQCSHFYCGQHF